MFGCVQKKLLPCYSITFKFVFADASHYQHQGLKDCNKCFKKISRNPITKHRGLLLKFFIFNIFVPLTDFGTDIWAAQSFFQKGDFYWSSCTLLFVFLPFLGRLSIFFATSLKYLVSSLTLNAKEDVYDKEKYRNKMTKLKILCSRSPELIWHFPPLNILR